MEKENVKLIQDKRIGVVINTGLKPNRDVLGNIVHYIQVENLGKPLLFQASGGTLPENIKLFASNKLDGMIVCGVRHEVVVDFLRLMPNHPPIVVCMYYPLSEEDMNQMGNGGELVLDNEGIGRRAADFFIKHGHRNFAFIRTRVAIESIAGDIRCNAFRRRIEERLGANCTFAKFVTGVVAENEDFWEVGDNKSEEWIRALPLPCAVLTNDDREASNFIAICKKLGIRVPDDIEVLGSNNSHGFCEMSRPAISSWIPDFEKGARDAMNLLMALIENPDLPRAQRSVLLSSCKFVERGSTSSGEHGYIVARAREFIAQNACKGIGVMDVVANVGVSRRLLEKRVRETTGQSLLEMIQDVRLENVCRLLATTSLPISEVTERSGYEPTSNLSNLFRKRFGMTMRDYRTQNAKP